MQRAFEKIIERLKCKAMEHFDEDLGEIIKRDDVINIVNQVASEYCGGWIPVSSGKLPEDNKPVLCWVRSTTIASGETFIIGSCSNNKFWFLQTYEIGHHHFPVKDYEVVAWCELPEPYKAESEE